MHTRSTRALPPPARPPRARPSRAAVTVALVPMVALGALVAGAGVVADAPPAHAVDPFPVHDPFVDLPVGTTMPSGWARIASNDQQAAIVENGSAGKWLRMTDNAKYMASAVYNEVPYDSSNGLTVEFDQRMWSPTDTGYADGIGFFLQDAAMPLDSIGPVGGGLGYFDGKSACSAGLDGGVVGVGFDRFGNFALPEFIQNAVTVRGAEAECYPVLATTGNRGDGFLEDRGVDAETATYRHVKVDVVPRDAGGITAIVTMSDATPVGSEPAELHHLISTDLPATALPGQMRFGFSASTGGRAEFHEIRNVRATQPTDVVTTASVDTEGPVTSGDDVSFRVRSVNDGPATIGGPTDAVARTTALIDALPLEDVTWSCEATGGASCGADQGAGVVATDWTAPPGGQIELLARGTVPATTRSGTYSAPVESVTDFTTGRFDEGRAAVARDGSVSDVDLTNNTDTIAFDVVLPDAVASDDAATGQQGEPVVVDVVGNDALDGSGADLGSLRLTDEGLDGAELSDDGKQLRVPGRVAGTVRDHVERRAGRVRRAPGGDRGRCGRPDAGAHAGADGGTHAGSDRGADGRSDRGTGCRFRRWARGRSPERVDRRRTVVRRTGPARVDGLRRGARRSGPRPGARGRRWRAPDASTSPTRGGPGRRRLIHTGTTPDATETTKPPGSPRAASSCVPSDQAGT
ncbi:hypothetical protein QP157_01305 [Sphingomonas sp. LR61]|uniref:lectin-like domain-containing protein n=1 Tax=Sphingomonas sp. LR61 TaxID=3050234 RepID=UPI002FDF2810